MRRSVGRFAAAIRHRPTAAIASSKRGPRKLLELRHAFVDPFAAVAEIHSERRIVTDALWAAAQHRFASNRERYGVEKRASRSSLGRAARPSSYLLSGLLVCADCGAPMPISGGATDCRYCHCGANRKRGTCSNALERALGEGEHRGCILTGLRDTIASPVVPGYARKRIAERHGEITRGADGEHERQRQRACWARIERAKPPRTAHGIAVTRSGEVGCFHGKEPFRDTRGSRTLALTSVSFSRRCATSSRDAMSS